MGKCRLCGNDRKLCKSHILPEFVYTPVYEEAVHRYFQISTKENDRPKSRPKGLYEELLCRECEDRIGAHESYAREVIYGGTEIGCREETYGVSIADIDYPRFKLFQISILWRSGVSSREEFAGVDLGDHEGRMREMLLGNDPGEPAEFPCHLFYSQKLMNELGDLMILPPDPIEIGGEVAYRVYMGGFFWVFFLGDCSQTASGAQLFLSRDGVLPIVRADGYADNLVRELAYLVQKEWRH